MDELLFVERKSNHLNLKMLCDFIFIYKWCVEVVFNKILNRKIKNVIRRDYLTQPKLVDIACFHGHLKDAPRLINKNPSMHHFT